MADKGDGLPVWWSRWVQISTELIVDSRPPTPAKDVPYFEKLIKNNPRKDAEVVFQEAVNFLLGLRADGGRKYSRARGFMAGQFSKRWGGVKAVEVAPEQRDFDYLDRLIEEDARNLNLKRPSD